MHASQAEVILPSTGDHTYSESGHSLSGFWAYLAGGALLL